MSLRTNSESFSLSWLVEGHGIQKKKEYVKCDGLGPHVTKNGSAYLVVGFHRYTALQDGTYLCKACADRGQGPEKPRKLWLPRDTNKPCRIFLLAEADRTQLRIGLAELRKTFEKAQDRVLPKITATSIIEIPKITNQQKKL